MQKLINNHTGKYWDTDHLLGLYKEHLNPSLLSLLSFLKFQKNYVKAENCQVWDDQGTQYLDMLGGFGALNIGHNHPRVFEAIQEGKQYPNLLQTSMGAAAGILASALASLTPGDLQRTFFCNSGAEAVEGALKLARIASGKTRIISAEGSFHGKTLGALSATGKEKYQKPFAPLVPGFSTVPFGDTDALAAELTIGDVAAFIVEPILGEGGVILPPEGYLEHVWQLCKSFDVLLILDEVQTGLGRTGKMFACEHEGIEPDIMCLAKSLGGGVFPLGAYIATDEVWQKGYKDMERATLHSSTFGGNTLACAAGLATLEVLSEEGLVAHASELGSYLLAQLKQLEKNHRAVKEVRGKGLLLGIEFNQPKRKGSTGAKGLFGQVVEEYYGAMIAGELLNKHHIITAYTLNNPNVLRLEPPLTVSREQVDILLEAMEDVVKKFDAF